MNRKVLGFVTAFLVVLCAGLPSLTWAQTQTPICYPVIELAPGAALSNNVTVAPNTTYRISAFCYAGAQPSNLRWLVPSAADPGNVTSFQWTSPAAGVSRTIQLFVNNATVPEELVLTTAATSAPTCSINVNPSTASFAGTVVTLAATNCTNSANYFRWSVGGTDLTSHGATAQYVVTQQDINRGTPIPVILEPSAVGLGVAEVRGTSASSQIVIGQTSCSIAGAPATPVAAGTQLTLQAVCNPAAPPGTQYSWSDGQRTLGTTQTLAVAPTVTTTYTVTITPPSGQPITARVTVVVQPPSCTITGAPATAIVAGTPVTLSVVCTPPAATGTRYAWSPGGQTTQTITVAPTTTTTYTVTITPPGAQPFPVSVTVNVGQQIAPAPQASGNNQIAAANGALPNNLRVIVTNTSGQPQPNVVVTWTSSNPSDKLGGNGSTAQSTTASDGIAQMSVVLGAVAGPRTITASIGTSSFAFSVNTNEVLIGSGQALTAPQIQIAITTPTIQMSNIRQRLDQLRMQHSPTIASGLRVSVNGQALPPSSAFALAALDSNGRPVRQTGGGASADPDPFERWGVFVNGDIDVGRQSSVASQSGFKVTSKGVTIGADHRFVGNHVLGASLGFLKADSTIESGGDQDAKGYSFSAFGSYVPVENAYIDAIANVGHNTYDTRRSQPSGVDATASTSGRQMGLSLSAGYALNRGALALTPYGRVEYVEAKVKGFSENGTVTEAVSVTDQHVKATTLSIGAQASYAISMPWGVLLPNGHLELQRLVSNSQKDVSVSSINPEVTTPGFAIPISGQDKSFGNFAVGASAVFGRGISAFFNYEHLFGKSNASDNHYTLGLRVDF